MIEDEAFDAMADLQRRQLLVRLAYDDPQPVPRLSTASRELLEAHERFLREYLTGSYEVRDADKAAIRAYHVHLPKLVAYDYVEWHRDAHLVTRGPDFDDLRPLLELVDDRRDGQPPEDAPLIVTE